MSIWQNTTIAFRAFPATQPKAGFSCFWPQFPSAGQRLAVIPQLRLGFCVSGAVLGGAGLRASTELPMSTTSARAILHPRYETSHDSTGGKHVSSRGLKGVSPR